MAEYIEIAREHLRKHAEGNGESSRPQCSGETSGDRLKGFAVLVALECFADRVWITADSEDTQVLGDVNGDLVLTRPEIRELCKLRSAQALADPLMFKKATPGRVRNVSVFKSSREDSRAALATLKRAGVTTWTIDGIRSAQIPRENDSPEVRDALRVLGYGRLPVVVIESAEGLAV
jgi:hypothetical protein